MSAIDSYVEAAGAGRLAHRHQHHSFRQMAADRRGPAADDGERLRRILGNYIDEFAEMILSGLDAIWETAYGFPPDGARDLPAFKQFLGRPSAVRGVLQRVPGGDGAEHHQRSGVGPVTTPATTLAEEVLADIQGFITSGYGHLSHAAYLFLQFREAATTRRWLPRVAPAITSSRPWPVDATGKKEKPPVAFNIAFSAVGIRALGVPAEVVCTFPPEFQEGIASPERSRILGDTEESDPARWELGGPATPPVHAVLLVHAESETGSMPRARHSARCWASRQGVSSSYPAACRSDIGPTATTSRSVFMTASRSRPSREFPATACPRANSSSGIRTTFSSCRRRPSCRRHSTAARSCRRWTTPITRHGNCEISASTAPTWSIASSSRMSRASGSS